MARAVISITMVTDLRARRTAFGPSGFSVDSKFHHWQQWQHVALHETCCNIQLVAFSLSNGCLLASVNINANAIWKNYDWTRATKIHTKVK
jgi:hypothetical protein